MDILQQYSQALAQYKARNFDSALKLLADVKIAAPHFNRHFIGGD